jgi:CxxC motif-containing protein
MPKEPNVKEFGVADAADRADRCGRPSPVRELVCIGCPMGCRLRAAPSGSEVLVEGHSCERGRTYAIAELTRPMRTLPSTVRIRGAALKRLPVRSAAPVPKDSLFRCMEELRRVEVAAPIAMGEVIVENLGGTGVALVASRSVAALE